MSRLALLVLLTAFAVVAQDPNDPSPAGPSGLPPEQMVASIDPMGQLRLIRVSPAPGILPGWPAGGATAPVVPGEKAKAKVKVTTLLVTTIELEAKAVTAYTPDGRAIAADKLAALLVKERPVLVATDGKKVDPFLLQLYKEDTIVLVPPTQAFSTGGAHGIAVMPPGGPGLPTPVPLPPDRFDRKDAPRRDK